jgi:uncharacterized protein (DUF302 family)
VSSRGLIRLFLVLTLLVGPAAADNMLMARIPLRADITLEYLTGSVEEHGYKVVHLQLCDGGMSDAGYQSDIYRVVFFGKIDEVRMISERHPELVSYLPLKIAVMAEKDETLLAVLNPEALEPLYQDEALHIQFARWQNDLHSIFDDVRRAVAQRPAVSR